MEDKPKNLCLDFPMVKVNKPYHLEIDNEGNILYPECEKINGVNIVKQPKVAFEQLEKMLQGGFKRNELQCITACRYEPKSMFNNPDPLDNLEVVVDDENRNIVRLKSRNNSIDNLEWVTRDNNEFGMRALGKKDDFTLLAWDLITSNPNYSIKLKDVRKIYERSQKTYKLAIKNYKKFLDTYKGYRYKDVPVEIRDAVSKCGYPLSVLIRKSNEVRIILDWLNRGEVALVNVSNKHILKTINKIKRSVYENS